MPRASKTGLSGLYVDEAGRYTIHHRWADKQTGKRRVHKERLAHGVRSVAAKLRMRELLNSIADGSYRSPRELRAAARAETVGRLGSAFDRYLEHLDAIGVRTVGTRRAHCAKFMELLGAEKPLADLVAFDVERARKSLREGGASVGTINRYLSTLFAFVRWAEDVDGTMAPEVAARLRKARRGKEPPGRVRYVREDEEPALETLGGWLAPIVMAARLSGMRLGEIVSMRWHQVDRAARSIELPLTKSGKRRFVPITEGLSSVLGGLAVATSADAYVFPVSTRRTRQDAKQGEDIRRRNAVSSAFRDWTRANGIRDLKFHDLRHDFATKVRRSGGGLDTIASLLGHASLQMSARYAHLDDGELRRAAELVKIPIVVPHVVPEAIGDSRGVTSNRLETVGHLGLEPRANGLRRAGRPSSKPGKKR